MKPNVFSPAQLNQILKNTLPSDAKTGEKVVVGAIDKDGARVVASFKLKDKWEFQGAAEHDWDGDNTSVGAKVLLRWE